MEYLIIIRVVPRYGLCIMFKINHELNYQKLLAKAWRNELLYWLPNATATDPRAKVQTVTALQLKKVLINFIFQDLSFKKPLGIWNHKNNQFFIRKNEKCRFEQTK